MNPLTYQIWTTFTLASRIQMVLDPLTKMKMLMPTWKEIFSATEVMTLLPNSEEKDSAMMS
jgi:hypothetical protein